MATLKTGAKTVTLAGTRVALAAAPTLLRSISITANVGNVGQVYVGDSGVTSANTTPLGPGDSITIEPHGQLDLGTVYLDADISGEGVTFVANQD